MTIADDNVTPLPTLLERLGRRIDQAWQRIQKGEGEWVEGSLELAQALAEGRGRFSANKAFGDWLVVERHDHVNKDDRAALINLAADLTVARDVLNKTKRRSYKLIWTEEKGRFLHAEKTDKPKRGRPKGSPSRTTQRKRAGEIIKTMEALGETVTEKAVAERAGVGKGTADVAITAHFTAKEAAAEARQIALEDQWLDDAKFSDKSKATIADAIRIKTTRLDKQFEQVVNAEVRRRIDAANDAMRANYARLSQENLNLTRIVSQRGVFTETQYRQMLMLCHPDSSASPELKAELLQVLVQNKTRLIKP